MSTRIIPIADRIARTRGLLLALAVTAPASALAAEELPAFDCIITPSAVVEVSSAVPGVLESVRVERSDLVRRGQVLARLRSSVERAEREIARARAGMDADVRLGEANLEFEERNRDRLASMYQQKAVSNSEKDRAERDLAVSSLRLRQARDQMNLRQLELERAEQVLSERTIRSPIDGVVAQRYKSTGEYVEDQPVLRLAQLDPLHVEAILPIAAFGRVCVGMQAEVTPETVSNEPQLARVTVVDRLGDAASGTFGVRLAFANPDNRLPAGMKCSLRFVPAASATVAAQDQAQSPLDAFNPVADALNARHPSTATAPASPDEQPTELALDGAEGQAAGLDTGAGPPDLATAAPPGDCRGAPQDTLAGAPPPL